MIRVVEPPGLPTAPAEMSERTAVRSVQKWQPFRDAGLQFSKRDSQRAVVLPEDFEFALHIQFPDFVGFELVMGPEFSLHKCRIIEGLRTEQPDDKPDRLCIGLQQIVVARPHPCNRLDGAWYTDDCNLFELALHHRLFECGEERYPPAVPAAGLVHENVGFRDNDRCGSAGSSGLR